MQSESGLNAVLNRMVMRSENAVRSTASDRIPHSKQIAIRSAEIQTELAPLGRPPRPEPIAPPAGALASMAEVDAAAAARGRSEARRLAEWEAQEQQREAVAT